MSKCPDCDGVGFKEYDAGLVQIGCKACGMTGKVDCELTKEEFEKAYAFRSDMTPDQVAELGLVAMPSDCQEGWAMQKAEIVEAAAAMEKAAAKADADEKARLELELRQTEEGKEAVRQNRELKPSEYRCTKCSKPGKTIIHMVKKNGKGIGTKHLEFKQDATRNNS